MLNERPQPSRQIMLERLAAGVQHYGVPPTAMPKRTLQWYVRSLKEERGEPVPALDHSQSEADLAESIRRRLWDLVHVQLARLESASPSLDPAQIKALGTLLKDCEELERRRLARVDKATSTNPSHRANAKSAGGTTSSLAARLQRLASEPVDPVPDDSAQGTTDPGDTGDHL